MDVKTLMRSAFSTLVSTIIAARPLLPKDHPFQPIHIELTSAVDAAGPPPAVFVATSDSSLGHHNWTLDDVDSGKALLDLCNIVQTAGVYVKHVAT